ncbi:MAG: alpha-ribazole phosphatase [Marinifilaceae bacterium]
MEVYLIRHTSVDVEKGVCYGQKDVALAESYPEELATVKEKINGIEFDALYSSPLTRCKQLAGDLFDAEVQYDDRLMELNFGDWEGKEWDEIKDPAFPKWMDDFVNRKCTNGESFVILQTRVLEFWNELKEKGHEKVAVVTHGGVIRTLQALKNGIKLEEAFNEPPAGFGDVLQFQL